MSNIDKKDSVFANAADAVSDFETIFDEDDSIIEMVCGFGENGESLIGRDPEETSTTDNSDGTVDMEDSSPSTAHDIEPDAETGKGLSESVDLDDLLLEETEEEKTDETNKNDVLEEPVETEEKDFHQEAAEEVQTDETNKKDIVEEPDQVENKDFHNGEVQVDNVKETVDLDVLFDSLTNEGVELGAQVCDCCGKFPCVCGSGLDKPGEGGKSEEQTDDTNKSDILEEPKETEEKDFHNEGAELDALFESLEIEGEDEFDEFDDSIEGMDDEDIDENFDIGKGHINWFAEEAQDDEIDYAEDELIDAADNTTAGADLNLDYVPGEDDQIIDDVIDGKE